MSPWLLPWWALVEASQSLKPTFLLSCAKATALVRLIVLEDIWGYLYYTIFTICSVVSCVKLRLLSLEFTKKHAKTNEMFWVKLINSQYV